jgi:hypothetical protein
VGKYCFAANCFCTTKYCRIGYRNYTILEEGLLNEDFDIYLEKALNNFMLPLTANRHLLLSEVEAPHTAKTLNFLVFLLFQNCVANKVKGQEKSCLFYVKNEKNGKNVPVIFLLNWDSG